MFTCEVAVRAIMFTCDSIIKHHFEHHLHFICATMTSKIEMQLHAVKRL